MMAYDPNFVERINRIVRLVLEMLDQCRHDEAAVLLFDLHKLHIDEWVRVREALHGTCMSRSRLSELSTILNCSSSSSLSGWEHLIPGLSRFSAKHEPTELFD
jgi:hypothetical protein